MDSRTQPWPAMETQEERRIKLREHATNRLITELQHLVIDPPEEFSLGPIDEQDMSRWKATIMPKWESPYKGGVFFLKIQVPQDYPFKPPKVIQRYIILISTVLLVKFVWMFLDLNGVQKCQCKIFL